MFVKMSRHVTKHNKIPTTSLLTRCQDIHSILILWLHPTIRLQGCTKFKFEQRWVSARTSNLTDWQGPKGPTLRNAEEPNSRLAFLFRLFWSYLFLMAGLEFYSINWIGSIHCWREWNISYSLKFVIS